MSLSVRSKRILEVGLADRVAALEISTAIDSGANPIVQVISNGDITHTPSGDAVFDALALKLNSVAFSDANVTGKLITGFASGAGVVAATDTVLQAVNKLDGNVAAKQNALTMNSAACSAVGEIAIDGMTVGGAVMVTPIEDLGNDIVFSHVVCGVGKITVYQKDASGVSPIAATAVNAKTFGYIVIKLS